MTEPVTAHVVSLDAHRAEIVVTELYRDHFRSMVGLAAVFVDSHAEAEEVAQEAFVRLYSSYTKLRDRERALAYLRSIVLNQARSRLRRRRVARAKEPPPERERWDDAPDLGAAERQVVVDAVARLPRRQMECIMLRHYSGCADAEVAAALGISVGAVKKHLHRASTTLASNLEHLR
jgi:RNA polymerase sigma-70 factor (sigma-E family)